MRETTDKEEGQLGGGQELGHAAQQHAGHPILLSPELKPPRVAIPSWRVSKGGVIVG